MDWEEYKRLHGDSLGSNIELYNKEMEILLGSTEEVVRQRDALLEACEAALAHITGDGWDGNEGQHKDNPLPAQLRAAIAKARRE